MLEITTAVAVYDTQEAVEQAVRDFRRAGFDLKKLSVAVREDRHELHAKDYYGSERAHYSGRFGAFSVAGPLAAAVAGGLEGAAPMAGLTALGAGLHRFGVPRVDAVSYEAALEAGRHLLVASGRVDEIVRAVEIMNPGARLLRIHALPEAGATPALP